MVTQTFESYCDQTETAKRSLYFQGPSCFNELAIDIRSIESIVLFKSRVIEHFILKEL